MSKGAQRFIQLFFSYVLDKTDCSRIPRGGRTAKPIIIQAAPKDESSATVKMTMFRVCVSVCDLGADKGVSSGVGVAVLDATTAMADAQSRMISTTLLKAIV